MVGKLLFNAARQLAGRFPLVRRVVPAALVRRAGALMMRRWVAKLPDRRYLEDAILPAIRAGGFSRVLFVGTESFTGHYGRGFAGSATEFWTADIDPEVARYGEPGRHVICDVKELDRHFPAHGFDVVLLNGVFGFGVNDRPGMERAGRAIRAILRRGGILMIGWNPDRIGDPATLAALRERFRHGSALALPERVEIETYRGAVHVYDFYIAC